jgi:hypothetical protein
LCENDKKVSITYWDKNERVYKEIESDSTLMSAFGMYWDIRRLPLYCSIVEPVKQPEPSSANTEVDQSANNLPEQPDEQSHKEPDKEPYKEPEPSSANSEPENMWGEDDEVKYAGADDEQKMYKAMLSDDEQSDSEFIPDSDEEDHDDCVGADEKPEDDVLVGTYRQGTSY